MANKIINWEQAASLLLKVLWQGKHVALVGVDTAELYALARRHQVRSRIASHLTSQGINDEVFNKFAERTAARFESRLSSLRDIALAADLRGLPYVLLKGLPLGWQIYGKFEFRDSGDDDFLVDPSDLEIWNQILTNMGYRQYLEPVDLNTYYEPIRIRVKSQAQTRLVHNTAANSDFVSYECEEYHHFVNGYDTLLEIKFGLQGCSRAEAISALYGSKYKLDACGGAYTTPLHKSMVFYFLEVYANTYSDYGILSGQPRFRDFLDIASYLRAGGDLAMISEEISRLSEVSKLKVALVLSFVSELFNDNAVDDSLTFLNEVLPQVPFEAYGMSAERYLFDDLTRRSVYLNNKLSMLKANASHRSRTWLIDSIDRGVKWSEVKAEFSEDSLKICFDHSAVDLLQQHFRIIFTVLSTNNEESTNLEYVYQVTSSDEGYEATQFFDVRETVHERGLDVSLKLISSADRLAVELPINGRPCAVGLSVKLQRRVIFPEQDNKQRWANIAGSEVMAIGNLSDSGGGIINLDLAQRFSSKNLARASFAT